MRALHGDELGLQLHQITLEAYKPAMDAMKLYLEIHGSGSPNFYMTRNKQVAAACQMSVINGVRLELIGLAAFLSDLDPIEDRETVRRWLGLAGMLEEATSAIRQSFTDSRPLTVIPGGLA